MDWSDRLRLDRKASSGKPVVAGRGYAISLGGADTLLLPDDAALIHPAARVIHAWMVELFHPLPLAGGDGAGRGRPSAFLARSSPNVPDRQWSETLTTDASGCSRPCLTGRIRRIHELRDYYAVDFRGVDETL
ncbi:hypothetical protein [Limoniibacter endophyticus]|uniref:hypothetical protein n=1 Tax=Limoniibacter endophyticus TaxID=1565040 RepID=UPI0016781881|nr:hypothetical protein [Limoniibacter endophyticus]